MTSVLLQLRAATPDDVVLIVRFIEALAEYEKLRHACKADEELIRRWLFGEVPRAYCIIAEWGGQPAGFALYFYNFSTFLARPGIYIEDVFVDPVFRRKGIAKALFVALAQKAQEEGCGRVEWSVLDWNAPAIRFYESLGAVPMKEWIIQRLEGDALSVLANGNTFADDAA